MQHLPGTQKHTMFYKTTCIFFPLGNLKYILISYMVNAKVERKQLTIPRKLKKMKKPRMTLYDVPDTIFQADCKSRPCALKEIVNVCLLLTFRETTLYGKIYTCNKGIDFKPTM